MLPRAEEGEKEIPDKIKKYPINTIPSGSGTLQYYVAMARLLNDGVTHAEICGIARNGCVEEFSWVLDGSNRDDDLLVKSLQGYDTSKSRRKLKLSYKILEDLCL